MDINPLIFRAYDIRGIAQRDDGGTPDLTPETMYLLGRGIGSYMKKNYGPSIACGRDNRLSSEELFEAFVSGMITTGCTVTSIGKATSPMAYFAACNYDFDGAINITASHNPKDYNGVKIVAKNAHSVCGDELQEILKLIQAEEFESGKGELFNKEIFDDYLAYVKNVIKPGRKLKVVIDAGNGITGIFAPKLFRTLGHEVVELYCELDGNFPNHEANPESEANLKDLQKRVLEEGADLGIGFDGDGDRVGVIDEKGQFHHADYLLIPLSRALLAEAPGASVIFDIKSSKVVEDDIRKHGGNPIRYKTGHSFIETKMRETGALLAGETSGHIFFANRWFGFDDGMYAAARIAELVSLSDKPFSTFFDDIPKVLTTPEYKLACADHLKFKVIEDLSQYFTKRYPCLTIDGVWVDFGSGSWGAVRASNTSPNLTLRFEAETPEQLELVKKTMLDKLREYPEVNFSNSEF
ncbi:phosphomannomutase [Candidatus Peregrinibacteria bacterium CG_4_9_14_0_2_um_filter_53_11]|nr:MAG: phosphomannomutase [Candidatus Peregrinibacteria bacterium CG_4_9_14_0_2_um_filter_53_11]